MKRVLIVAAFSFVILCFLVVRSFKGGVQETKLASVKSGNTLSSGSDGPEARFLRSAQAAKSSKRNRISGGKTKYNLTEDEIVSFLSKKGESVESLYFVLLCSENRDFLNKIEKLPESVAKNLVLSIYNSDDVEKLAFAQRAYEYDSDDPMAILMLAEAQARNAQISDVELLEKLKDSAARFDSSSSLGSLMSGFSDSIDVFGKERTADLLEYHGANLANNLRFTYSGFYIDSVLGDGSGVDGDLDDLIDSAQTFSAAFVDAVGYSNDTVELNQMLILRDWISVNRDELKLRFSNLDEYLLNLGENMSSEALKEMESQNYYYGLSSDERERFIFSNYDIFVD